MDMCLRGPEVYRVPGCCCNAPVHAFLQPKFESTPLVIRPQLNRTFTMRPGVVHALGHLQSLVVLRAFCYSLKSLASESKASLIITTEFVFLHMIFVEEGWAPFPLPSPSSFLLTLYLAFHLPSLSLLLPFFIFLTGVARSCQFSIFCLNCRLHFWYNFKCRKRIGSTTCYLVGKTPFAFDSFSPDCFKVSSSLNVTCSVVILFVWR